MDPGGKRNADPDPQPLFYPIPIYSVSDPYSGVFWIRIRIRNPDPGAKKKVKNVT